MVLNEQVVERLLEAPCGHLGSIIGCLGALLVGLVPQIYCKDYIKYMFPKMLIFAIFGSWAVFVGHLLHLGAFGLHNENSISMKSVRKYAKLLVNFWTRIGDILGAVLGAEIDEQTI